MYLTAFDKHFECSILYINDRGLMKKNNNAMSLFLNVFVIWDIAKVNIIIIYFKSRKCYYDLGIK